MRTAHPRVTEKTDPFDKNCRDRKILKFEFQNILSYVTTALEIFE